MPTPPKTHDHLGRPKSPYRRAIWQGPRSLRKKKKKPEEAQATSKGYVFGYGRVSTMKQEISIDAQQTQVEEYCKSRLTSTGNLSWGGWYCDPAVSGSDKFRQRPAGGKL